MAALTTTSTSLELGHLVKSNLYDFFRLLSHGGMTDMIVKQSWMRWNTPVSHPWFRGMLCRNPTTSLDADLVRDTIAYFSSHHVANFTWWFAPALPIHAWNTLLEPFNLCYDDHIPGMALELTGWQADQKPLPGFSIQGVEDAETLKTWVRTFVSGFELPSSNEEGLFNLLKDIGLGLPLRHYLGFLQDQPVATSSLFLSEESAGVMFVSTLPSTRGRGFGSALTRAALLDARELGHKMGILQSSRAGFPVYQRLGFRQVCNMEYYLWSADPT